MQNQESPLILPKQPEKPTRIFYTDKRRLQQSFSRRLEPLIQNANLTMRQRENIGAVIDREIRLVFVEGKATMEDRLNFWAKKRMDDKTKSFMYETTHAAHQIFEEKVEPWIRVELGHLYKSPDFTQADRMAVRDRALRIYEECIYQLPTTVAAVRSMAAEMRKKVEESAARRRSAEKANEEARLRSIQLAKSLPKV